MRHHFASAAFVLLLLTPGLVLGQEATPDPSGFWEGAIETPGGKLGIVVTLERSDDGWTGILDIPQQGAAGIELVDVTVEGRKVGFVMKDVPGRPTFAGILSEDGDRISGPYIQGGRPSTFSLQRTTERREPSKRPQEPKAPFPYTTRDVTFDGGANGVRLAGTIAVPAGDGPFPALVFATGSGAQDRDETLVGHKPFLVLADHLARHGIASLRYDDRGVNESTGSFAGSTVGDFADDFRAAFRFLREQPEVKGRSVGLLGHSEGGLLALKIAAAGEPVDFLVLLAAPGEMGADLLARQFGDMLAAQGAPETQVHRGREWHREKMHLVARRDLPLEERRARLQALFRSRLADPDTEPPEATAGAISREVDALLQPWPGSFAAEDPATYLSDIDVPVLALFGGKDLHVAAEPNAAVFRQGFEAAGHKDHDIRILPGLNHLFQHAETGLTDEYALIEETFAPEALEIVSGWVTERASSPEEEATQRD